MGSKTVFFDRDGVLNVDVNYLYRPEDFVWIDGAKDAIRYLKQQDYLVIVITNQSGVARGYYGEEDVIRLHEWMNEQLEAVDAHIDAFYYCPHHPDGALEQYRQKCFCRKPEPGLILQAIDEWSVDVSRSILIGDKRRDIEAAQKAGIKGYLFTQGNLFDFILRTACKTPPS